MFFPIKKKKRVRDVLFKLGQLKDEPKIKSD